MSRTPPGKSHEIPTIDPDRGVFCNRTLNLRGLRAIGYDMDYTLIHYRVDEWERAAFEYARARLAEQGWPVADLAFDPGSFTLGLIFDLGLGNLVKATRFGYVVRAQHGARLLAYEELRVAYDATVIDLGDERFEFMNTLFELSRAALWTQLVDLQDRGNLPGVSSYAQLYRRIDEALEVAHRQGELKADILANPQRYVVADSEIVTTLTDQRFAGKELLLVTNSDWSYTKRMMSWCFDGFMPQGQTWRNLFDLVIVSADKPRFFAADNPIYRVVDETESLLAPHRGELERGHVYHGGNARMIEQALGHKPSQFLYVGDHLFGDVYVTKDVLRWRTALIARELEAEIAAASEFSDDAALLGELMAGKTALEYHQANLRLRRRRLGASGADRSSVEAELAGAAQNIETLDARITPLAQAAAEQGNPIWGPLMRSGVDKSLFAYQVERYADVYTSRVANFRPYTPYAYLRAARSTLPHDRP